jgi:peptide/nickel transport system ATP-binding protein
MMTDQTLLEIENLKTYFFLDEGTVKAVDGVSLSLAKGKTLGIVGESGCGKSVMARSVLQIAGAAGKVVEGRILFRRDGDTIDVAQLSPTGESIRQIRGRDIAMIFQEPMTSFSPVHTVGKQIMEAILYHTTATKTEARERAIELLGKVGIPQPRRTVDAYPFELSGGMRQRAMIAMALAGDPSLLIADEPTTALDVTIQAQILALLQNIQRETGMAIMIISHNMGVIAEMADEVAVMYLGRVVEQASVWELFDHPSHPYTISLLKSIPLVEEEARERLESIKGSVPDPYATVPGCPFHRRCPSFMPGLCDVVLPVETPVAGNPAHTVRCHLFPGSAAGAIARVSGPASEAARSAG